jgi:hypothetical protein
MARAINTWGFANVKTIGYAEIEDYLYSQSVSDKTRANMKSCLHDFFMWLKKRKVITLQQFPDFPEINFELGWRNIIDIETQQEIISEVYRITHKKNIKIWLGIYWLSVYISVRPGELLSIKEWQINRRGGFITIPYPKEKHPKIIYLLDDDIKLLNEIPPGLPELYFFRHTAGIKGVKAGQRFGSRYLYKYWKKACDNLKIEGVDLYGGTRHSTTTALSEKLSYDEVKAGSLHATNKAFDRYFQGKQSKARMVYSKVKDLQQTYNKKDNLKPHNILKFKD